MIGLGGEEKELKNYSVSLESAKSIIVRYGILWGLSVGLLMFSLFCNEALGFYAGTKFIINKVGDYNLAKVLTTFISVMTGTTTIG